MGAAKKVENIDQNLPKKELVAMTSTKKATKKKKGPRPIKNLGVAPVTEQNTRTIKDRQDQSIMVADHELPQPTKPDIDFGQLSAQLTRPQGLTHDQVEAALNACAPDKEKADQPITTPLDPDSGSNAPLITTAMPRKKLPFFLALILFLALLGFYVHLNQNIQALTQQVQDLSTIKTNVSTLDTKIATMETRVADLETLPAQTRAALLSSILQEMSQKTSYMSTQVESPEQQDKLMRAKELMQQVQTELNTQH